MVTPAALADAFEKLDFGDGGDGKDANKTREDSSSSSEDELDRYALDFVLRKKDDGKSKPPEEGDDGLGE